MNQVTILQTISAKVLESVGQIDWTAVPALSTLSFGTKGVTDCPLIKIDNTAMTSIAGINPSTVDTLSLSNNIYLQSLDMDLNNVTGALDISYNGPNLVVNLKSLEWAFNISMRAVNGVNLPALVSTNQSLGFFESKLADLQLANLTNVGETFIIVSNNDLTSLSAPELETVSGGLQIANNSMFENITFPSLTTVGGALTFIGSLST